MKKAFVLYIPIWFYSNPVIAYLGTMQLFFTFQSGSIQIKSNSFIKLISRELYIPIWFYSNNCINLPSMQLYLPLHSNLVLFK